MKGSKKTEEELKEEGWEYESPFAVGRKIFKKGNKRLLWNEKTQIVEQEFIKTSD